MSIYLQTDTASLAAEEGFNESQMSIQSSFTKLSSGYSINTAADDAAGLGFRPASTPKSPPTRRVAKRERRR